MRELHVAGCNAREIAETLGYRAHSHIHRYIRVYRRQVEAMRAFDGAWWMTDLIDIFEDMDMPLPPMQEVCSLPWGGPESYDMEVFSSMYSIPPRAPPIRAEKVNLIVPRYKGEMAGVGVMPPIPGTDFADYDVASGSKMIQTGIRRHFRDERRRLIAQAQADLDMIQRRAR